MGAPDRIIHPPVTPGATPRSSEGEERFATPSPTEWKQLQEWLNALPVNDELRNRWRRGLDQVIADAGRAAIMFRPLPGGAWLIDGRVYRKSLPALEAGWRALRGERVRAAEYCEAGTSERNGRISVRYRLHLAAEWLAEHGHMALADIFDQHMRVLDGLVVYEPARGTPTLDL